MKRLGDPRQVVHVGGAVHSSCSTGRIGQVSRHGFDVAGIGEQRRKLGRIADNGSNRIAALQEQRDQVAADETCGTRDEGQAHVSG